jgi:hypothetical protein
MAWRQKRRLVVIGYAKGMLRRDTPIEDYTRAYGLYVKREDLACPDPGPHFSKARGVYAHILKQKEDIIGVLDTRHSQAGHAVARACQVLGKQCINYYPEFKHEPGPRGPQLRARALGATLESITAGRSAILFHKARCHCEKLGGYMMPNALKLDESVAETAKEVTRDKFDVVIVPVSSGTIAAGVLRGLAFRFPKEMYSCLILHLGYSRSHEQVRRYVEEKAGTNGEPALFIVDEAYAYKDRAKPGPIPPWPCDEYYDLKTFRWWMENRQHYRDKRVLFWNIG